MSSEIRIIFMGTPEFAIESLDSIIDYGYNVVGVVTMPDKASGRGNQIHKSAIKKYAEDKNLKVLQPSNLKDSNFLEELEALKATVFVVVAFRMLPEVVWRMPRDGTINLHASMLPDYRGAAPINWTIINGDSETGLSTFFIEKDIDTGKIILQERVQIPNDWSVGQLHDDMMTKGAKLLLDTLKLVELDECHSTEQKLDSKSRPAPKIFKKDCKVDWNNTHHDIYNHIRGLNPYPVAWSELVSSEGKIHSVKIYNCSKSAYPHNIRNGAVLTDGKSYLKVACREGVISIKELQLAGKKKMAVVDFLRGFTFEGDWKFQ